MPTYRMFSYYGSKSKLVKLYPAPTRSRIVEPFAGSARYALQYPEREVWLNDSNPTITRIWDYLIHATEADVKQLPELRKGESLKNVKHLAAVERDLLGFAVARGVERPHLTVTKWSEDDGEIAALKRRMLSYLPRIRHWKVTTGDYRNLPLEEATWFIDPPYHQGGERYPHHDISFGELSGWCRSVPGQVIVCEVEGANWLPFRPLKRLQGQQQTNRLEVVWINDGKSCPKQQETTTSE